MWDENIYIGRCEVDEKTKLFDIWFPTIMLIDGNLNNNILFFFRLIFKINLLGYDILRWNENKNFNICCIEI